MRDKRLLWFKMQKFIKLTENYDLPDREHRDVLINVIDVIRVEEVKDVGSLVAIRELNRKGKIIINYLPVKEKINEIEELLCK